MLRRFLYGLLPALLLFVTAPGENPAWESTPQSALTSSALDTLPEWAAEIRLEGDLIYLTAVSIDSLATGLRRAGVPADSASSWSIHFHKYGNKAGVDPFTLAAMAYYESGFVPTAYNPNDPSWGMLQVMPRHWERAFAKECGVRATPKTLMIPEVAICHGAYIAAHFSARHPGNPRAGITAYNNGSGRPNGYSEQVLRRKQLLS